MTRRTAPGLISLCLLATPVAAQEEPIFGGVIDVELVLVDAVVEDGSGTPVLDLARDEFRLFQDGEPMAIDQFTEPGRVPAAPEGSRSPAPGAAPQAPRRLILFIDNLHLHPNSRKRVFDKLTRVLDSYLEPRDEVMMVTYGGTTRVALEMTSNRRALKTALREHAESGAVSLLASNDDQRILDLLQQIRFTYTDGGGGASSAESTACRDVGHLAHAHAQQVYSRVIGSVAELTRFVNSLAGYEGPKALLHVSDGIPLVAGNEAYRYASELCDGTGISKGIPNSTDTTFDNTLKNRYWDPTKTATTLREFDTGKEWTRLASNANTYQVSFYTLQAHQPTNRSSSITDTRTSFDVELEARRNRQDALFMLADETGGVALLDSNDVEPALARMSADARFGYQLAFTPPAPGDGKQHQIRVEVTRPGLQVRHRKSYRSKPAAERIEDRVTSALMHGLSDNPLGVRLSVDATEHVERDLSSVRVSVRVPLDRIVLLPEDEVRRGLFTVFVAVRDAFDQVSPVGRKTVPVRIPSTGAESEFVYTVEVPVRGERGTVAVAVQDDLGAEVSYVRQELRLPSGS